MKKLIIALVAACMLSSCGKSLEQYRADAAWIEANRRTYDAVAPKFRSYVENDPKLNDEAGELLREQYLALLEDWLLNLVVSENGLAARLKEESE